MSIITLTSDYGLVDYRVAAIKGSILSLKPEARITDISHEIQAYNLLQTAYIIRSVYSFYPKGTIHIIAVDSFYHKRRKQILVKMNEQYFITSDNGLLSLIFYDYKIEDIYEITLNNRFDDEVKFVSTDIFVPVAVHLANGGLPEVIGRKIDSIKEISFPKAIFNESEKMIVGEVMYIDNFGNAVTNITKNKFTERFKLFQKFEVKFRNLSVKKIHNRYTDLITDWEKEQEFHGKDMAIFNNQGLLELAIYKGSKSNGASTLLGVNIGERIFIEFE